MTTNPKFYIETDSAAVITGTNGASYPDFQEQNALVDYAAENDCELIIFPSVPIDCSYESGEVKTDNWANRMQPAIEACQDARVNYWINVESPMDYSQRYGFSNPFPLTRTSTLEDYSTIITPLFDFIEQDTSPYFQGYQFEGIWDIGVQWLYDRKLITDLKMLYMWSENEAYAIPGTHFAPDPITGPSQTRDYRLSKMDAVCYTLYWVYSSWGIVPWEMSAVENCITLMNYEPTGYTKPPVGVQVSTGIWSEETVMSAWADYQTMPQLTIAEQKMRAAKWLWHIKENAHAFENVCVLLGGKVVIPQTPHWTELLAFYKSQNLCLDVPQINLTNIAYEMS